MDAPNIQVLLFQHIKSLLPSHLSMVDEVADLLEISNDSAYRRIRGEKPITLEEIQKICIQYHLSLDQLMNLQTDTRIFSGSYISLENDEIESWLKKMLQDLQHLQQFKKKEIIHLSKDIPIPHYFSFPELASFKFFGWMKTLLQYKSLGQLPFSFEQFLKPMEQLGIKIARTYTLISGAEILNVDNINTTLRQLEFYKDTGMIKSADDLKVIYAKLHEMVNHLEAQAEAGVKFMPGEKPNSQSAEYKLYVNDFIAGDNSYVAIVDGNIISYINHNIINYMSTRDPVHNAYSYQFIQNILRNSILISKVGAKQRSRFFNLIREHIEESRNNKLKTLEKI